MEQKIIVIGQIEVPVIIYRGEEWFPVSFISEKVLRRSNSILSKDNRKNFENYVQKFNIKFTESNMQESNCINKDGLIKLLHRTQVGRLNSEKRKSQNYLHEYLEIYLLPTDDQDTNYYKDEWFNELDEYTEDVVKTVIDNENVELYRGCSKCNKHLPLTNIFFSIDSRADKGFTKVCKICKGVSEHFAHPDKDKNNLMKQNEELYKAMNNDYLPRIFEAYKTGEIKRLPDTYENKESYEKIVRYLYDKGKINKDNLTLDYLTKECGLKGLYKYFTIEEIYSMLYGDCFYFYTWKYPKFHFRGIELTYDIANKILDNYIRENNIVIDDIFTYDYENLFSKCGIRNITNGKTLEFIVQYYKNTYAGYCFKTTSGNYYKNENNLLHDLKYLIEVNMKIEVEKVPLYITKNVLQKKVRPIYDFIVTKKNGSIYKWIDRLYPNKFTETDFDINPYRSKFDSDTESFIHNILKEELNNVIYNPRNSEHTITIAGKVPDWLVFTDSGVYIVEYFGMYVEGETDNSRIKAYEKKMNSKLDVYSKLSNYKFLFIYPDDTKNNFDRLRSKIKILKSESNFTML